MDNEAVAAAIIRFNEALKAALLATAPEPITVKLWLPAPPENRRLPMLLRYPT